MKGIGGVATAADEHTSAETCRAEVLERTGNREELVRLIDAAAQHPMMGNA